MGSPVLGKLGVAVAWPDDTALAELFAVWLFLISSIHHSVLHGVQFCGT